MTVYKGSSVEMAEIVQENIILSDYKTSEELHGLFEDLGFEKHEMNKEGRVPMTKEERTLQDHRLRDEEEIRRKRAELNRIRAQNMRNEDRPDVHGSKIEHLEEKMAATKDEHYRIREKLQLIDQIIEDRKSHEERLGEISGNRDLNDEEVVGLKKAIEKFNGKLARMPDRDELQAKGDKLYKHYHGMLQRIRMEQSKEAKSEL